MKFNICGTKTSDLRAPCGNSTACSVILDVGRDRSHYLGANFGFAPYSLFSGLPSEARNTISMIVPTNGTSDINSHHPLRLVSWRRLIATAKLGTNTAKA
jgi:hypothetical protein